MNPRVFTGRILMPAVLLAAMAAPAYAADHRLVERLYDPAQVVVIEGKPNVQATITFEDGEQIENVAIGDSSSWQVTPNKRANLLFVKPLAPRASTNMTVVTDKRTYLFDLVASPTARPLYVLNFTYPEEPESETDTQMALAANAVEMAAASDPYAVTDPAHLNFGWVRTGSARLMPEQIYDDGNATFITWAASVTVPAILVKDENGTEGPVNFAVRGATTVVDGVPAQIILRWGDEFATLTKQGTAPATGAKSGSARNASNAAMLATTGN